MQNKGITLRILSTSIIYCVTMCLLFALMSLILSSFVFDLLLYKYGSLIRYSHARIVSRCCIFVAYRLFVFRNTSLLKAVIS